MSTPVTSPRVGMMATVRNRRGLVVSVDPFDASPDTRLHLVRIEYTDPDGAPDDTLLWEREHNRALLEPTALPRVADLPPMPGDDFDALARATRWSAPSPFLSPDNPDLPSDLDANPWRTFPRIIASYYYLRQPDVLEQFLAVCRAQTQGAYQLGGAEPVGGGAGEPASRLRMRVGAHGSREAWLASS